MVYITFVTVIHTAQEIQLSTVTDITNTTGKYIFSPGLNVWLRRLCYVANIY